MVFILIGKLKITRQIQSGRPSIKISGTLGIPYFAYMMSVISDLINGKMDQLRKLIERNTTKMVPCYFIPIIYTIVGFIFLIVVPSIIFTIMEGTDFWSNRPKEGVYYIIFRLGYC